MVWPHNHGHKKSLDIYCEYHHYIRLNSAGTTDKTSYLQHALPTASKEPSPFIAMLFNSWYYYVVCHDLFDSIGQLSE